MAKKPISSKVSDRPEETALTDDRRVIMIPVTDIDDSNRLRLVDPDKAMMMATSVETRGLLHPVEIRPSDEGNRPWKLVTGGHRLAAFRLLERPEIPAIILDIDALEARDREIDENVFRADLTELERAIFFDARKKAYEAKFPQAKHGGDRKSDQVAIFGDLIARFTQEALERLDCSERTVQRILARAKIAPDVRTKIAHTPLANKGAELDALLKLTPDEQRKAVKLVLSVKEDAPKTIAAAKNIIRGVRTEAEASPNDRLLTKLSSLFDNASARVQADFLNYLEQRGRVLLPAARQQVEAA